MDGVGIRVLVPRPPVVGWFAVVGAGGGGILDMAVRREVRSWRGVGRWAADDGDDVDILVCWVEEGWWPFGEYQPNYAGCVAVLGAIQGGIFSEGVLCVSNLEG